MAMSRKHYRIVAEALNSATDSAQAGESPKDIIERLAMDLGRMFKEDNSNFRYDIFFDACGLNSWGEIPDSAKA